MIMYPILRKFFKKTDENIAHENSLFSFFPLIAFEKEKHPVDLVDLIQFRS